MMEQDIIDFDPFEPMIFDYDIYDEWIIYSEPMEDYNWEEWLEGGNDETFSYWF